MPKKQRMPETAVPMTTSGQPTPHAPSQQQPAAKPLAAFVDSDDDDLGRGAMKGVAPRAAPTSLSPHPAGEATSEPPPPPLAGTPALGRRQKRGTQGHVSLELVSGDGGAPSGAEEDDWDVEAPVSAVRGAPGIEQPAPATGGVAGNDSDDISGALSKAGLSGSDLRARLAHRLAGTAGTDAAMPLSGVSGSGGHFHGRGSTTKEMLGTSSTGLDQLMMTSSSAVSEGGFGGAGGTMRAGWQTLGGPSPMGASGSSAPDLALDPFAAFDEKDFAVDTQAEALRAQQHEVEALAECVTYDGATHDPQSVRTACEDLIALFASSPHVRQHFVRSHGAFHLVDTLTSCAAGMSPDGQHPHHLSSAEERSLSGSISRVSLQLTVSWVLRVVNALSAGDSALLESLSLVGILPAVLQFTAGVYPSPIRRQAAMFTQQLLEASRASLQVFVACGGAHVLISLLEPSPVPTFAEDQLAAILDDEAVPATGCTPPSVITSATASAPGSPEPVHASPGKAHSGRHLALPPSGSPLRRRPSHGSLGGLTARARSIDSGVRGTTGTAAGAADPLAAWEFSHSANPSPVAGRPGTACEPSAIVDATAATVSFPSSVPSSGSPSATLAGRAASDGSAGGSPPQGSSTDTIELDDLLLLLHMQRDRERERRGVSGGRRESNASSAEIPTFGSDRHDGRHGHASSLPQPPPAPSGSLRTATATSFASSGTGSESLRRRYGVDVAGLQERYVLQEAALVATAAKGVLAVFSMQTTSATSLTPNEFRRLFIKCGLLRPLSAALRSTFLYVCSQLTDALGRQAASAGAPVPDVPPLLGYCFAGPPPLRAGHAHTFGGSTASTSFSAYGAGGGAADPVSISSSTAELRAALQPPSSLHATGSLGNALPAPGDGTPLGSDYDSDSFESESDEEEGTSASQGASGSIPPSLSAGGGTQPPGCVGTSTGTSGSRPAVARETPPPIILGAGATAGAQPAVTVPRFISPRSEASESTASESGGIGSPPNGAGGGRPHPGHPPPAQAGRAGSARRGFFTLGSDAPTAAPSAAVLSSSHSALPPISKVVEASMGNLTLLCDVLASLAQGDAATKMALAAAQVGLLTSLLRMLRPAPYALLTAPRYAGVVLRALKVLRYVSMDPDALEALDACGAVGVLVLFLTRGLAPAPGHRRGEGGSSAGGRLPDPGELSVVMHTLFNLLRVNKARQQAAAAAGVVPALQRIIARAPTLKPLAIPLICDLAFAGAKARTALEEHAAYDTLLSILSEPYWHVHALAALSTWTASSQSLCGVLSRPASLDALVRVFRGSSTYAEAVLPPLLAIAERCSDVAGGLSQRADFMTELCARLSQPAKAIMVKHMLGLLRAVFVGAPDQAALLKRWALPQLVGQEVMARVGDKAMLAALAQSVLTLFMGTPRPPHAEA